MLASGEFQTEYDSENKIVHVTTGDTIRVQTLEEGLGLAEEIKKILAGYLQGERGYFVVDYTKIHIETRYVRQYSLFIRELYDRFIYPDGIARYGMSISRVIAFLSHREYLNCPANLFGTKREAFMYIHKLARTRQKTAVNG